MAYATFIPLFIFEKQAKTSRFYFHSSKNQFSFEKFWILIIISKAFLSIRLLANKSGNYYYYYSFLFNWCKSARTGLGFNHIKAKGSAWTKWIYRINWSRLGKQYLFSYRPRFPRDTVRVITKCEFKISSTSPKRTKQNKTKRKQIISLRNIKMF